MIEKLSQFGGEGFDAAKQAQQKLDHIVHNPALEETALLFGFEGFASEATNEKLQALKTFSNENWDFRGGKERWEAQEFLPTKKQRDLIYDTSRNFGPYNLLDSSVPEFNPDVLAVLGGGNDSLLLRLRYAEETVGVEGLKAVFMLGSARQVTDAERAKTDKFSLGAKTEFDLANSAVKRIFEGRIKEESFDSSLGNSDSDMSPEDPDYWAINSYILDSDIVVRSLLAKQDEGARRANTSDTFKMLREIYSSTLLGSKVAVSTHALYTAFQGLDAMRMLGVPLNVQTDTFGFNAAYSGVDRQPSQLLQEINSALNSAVKLQNEIVE